MKYYFTLFITLLITGCASDPANRAAVANEEVSILAPPSKALSEFSDYELKPLAMSEPVKADEDKDKVSKELEAKLIARINPLLSEWRGKNDYGATKPVLIIEPIVQKLRVVSGGVRFWAGAMVGESFIDLDLKLTDSTGQVIAMPRVHQSAGAMAGAWSFGSTDRNLLDYVTDIAYRYLEVNYSRQDDKRQ